MLGPISLYLGTRFLSGLRKLLDFAVLILRCSRHTALGHGYLCLCSTYYFGVDLMPRVRVHFVWVHQRFKVSWDLCLLVM